MRAIAQDQDAARLMGIDVDQTIAFTFLLAGSLAGAGRRADRFRQIGTTVRSRVPIRPVRVYRRRSGRYRQPEGAALGGLLIGFDKGLQRGCRVLCPGQELEHSGGLYRADPGDRVPATGPDRQPQRRKGVTWPATWSARPGRRCRQWMRVAAVPAVAVVLLVLYPEYVSSPPSTSSDRGSRGEDERLRDAWRSA